MIKKIILLDDNKKSVQARTDYLNSLGYVTKGFTDHKEMWVYMKSFKFYPDLYIIDHDFEGHTHKGCDILLGLRGSEEPEICSALTLILSGNVRYTKTIGFYIDGCECSAVADMYLPKPAGLEDLIKTIKEMEK